MYLSLMREKEIQNLNLPDKVQGRYFIEDEKKLLVIEGIDNKWLLKSTKNAQLIADESGVIIDKIELKENTLTSVAIGDEIAVLLATRKETNEKTFTKYEIPSNGEISIGRLPDNIIEYRSELVTSKHAIIHIIDGKMILTDLNSTNRTYLNNQRAYESELKPGDIIDILGLRIIIGNSYIAINNPRDSITINGSILKEYVGEELKPVVTKEQYIYDEDVESNYFYRSPRFKREIIRKKFKIDPPPHSQNSDKTPAILVIGPMVTMGLATCTTAAFTIINTTNNGSSWSSTIPSLVMSVSMLAGTMLWPLINRRYEAKKAKKSEKIRCEKYRQYLQDVQNDIRLECQHQQEILLENYVDLNECQNRVLNIQRNLWERVIGQDDFLKLRLGISNLPLDAEFSYPQKNFELQTDDLKEELYKLVNTPKELINVPVAYSLIDNFICGIYGQRKELINYLKGIILQICALHSYDEVKIVLLYKDTDDLKFAKWLPHIWSLDEEIRLMAKDLDELKEVSSYIEKELQGRLAAKNENKKNYKDIAPYYVVISTNKELTDRADFVNEILAHKETIGASLIAACEDIKDLPKECKFVIELSDKDSKLYNKQTINDKPLVIQPDFINNIDMENVATKLANIKLNEKNKQYVLPDKLGFLEMFEAGKIEHLNILKRWKENDTSLSLKTPVGVNEYGDIFMIDLHEKYHGPHGLIAGMTGSGKSEFIITYILSMAVNYHPSEVAFILIDYKGGGLAGAFKNDKYCLPHVIGTITNLDGASIQRSMASLDSELKRRQRIFNEAKKVSDEGTMDIYKYQKLYRENVVSEPLPHLFIIADEFAELKSQQREFMDKLISIARIGRSLGVHLILATQKPTGVVDDQIWSNSKFKVCLKVQDAGDSNEIIKRPDAAMLKNVGRFYLQVGYNEYFAKGQSAYCGGAYNPTDRITKEEEKSITVIDGIGRHLKESKLKSINLNNHSKQITEIVKYISQIADSEGIQVKKLWLEPLSANIYLGSLISKYHYKGDRNKVEVVIGELDKPKEQIQSLFTIRPEDGNILVYGASNSGKEDLLNTFVYYLINCYKTNMLNLYILDFGSETLQIFANAPQVGDVVLNGDDEKIRNLFKMLKQEIKDRKNKFLNYGGSYRAYMDGALEKIANIIVMINNFEAFYECYSDYTQELVYLSREGIKYGINLVLTADTATGVKYQLAANFSQTIVMQLNDQLDYSSILGSVNGVYPSKIKGRGIIKDGDEVYEFQASQISPNISSEMIMKRCSEISDEKAPSIPVLPEKVDLDFLKSYKKSLQELPIGINANDLSIKTLDLTSREITLITSSDVNRLTNFESCLVEELKMVTKVKVIDPENMVSDGHSNVENEVRELFNEMVKRNNQYKKEGKRDFEKTVYVINSISELFKMLSADGQDKLKVLLEKTNRNYCIYIIICDIIGNVSNLSMETWFKAHLNDGDGVWVGNNITQQYVLKLSDYSSLNDDLGAGFGYVVHQGKTELVKLLSK